MIAKLNGQPVGISWASGVGYSLYSNRLYVVKNFRGLGIGRALKAAQIKLAEDKGFLNIETDIAADNFSSLKVHDRSGFKLVPAGETVHAFLDLTKGKVVPCGSYERTVHAVLE